MHTLDAMAPKMSVTTVMMQQRFVKVHHVSESKSFMDFSAFHNYTTSERLTNTFASLKYCSWPLFPLHTSQLLTLQALTPLLPVTSAFAYVVSQTLQLHHPVLEASDQMVNIYGSIFRKKKLQAVKIRMCVLQRGL